MLENDPLWYKDAIFYEVHVRAFQDSDGDGIGDLRGLTNRLDYINDGKSATTHDLGANCIWLMPVFDSPSYHGYDVRDYERINPQYGALAVPHGPVAWHRVRGNPWDTPVRLRSGPGSRRDGDRCANSARHRGR